MKIPEGAHWVGLIATEAHPDYGILQMSTYGTGQASPRFFYVTIGRQKLSELYADVENEHERYYQLQLWDGDEGPLA